jgi:hypothetical protein
MLRCFVAFRGLDPHKGDRDILGEGSVRPEDEAFGGATTEMDRSPGQDWP